MRERWFAIAALMVAACRGADAPSITPGTVTEGQVLATALAITGQDPETYLVATDGHLALAADYVATIGDAATTIVAADRDAVTVQLDRELPVGHYPLDLTARGDHWLVEDALEVVPVDPLVDAPLGGGCDPTAPDLVACYPFEDSAIDVSAHHLDGHEAGNTAYQAGRIGQAIKLSGGQVTVDDAAILNLAQVSLEAWIRPTSLPTTGNRSGIIDSDGRFGMFLRPGGDLSCTASVAVTAAAAIPSGNWSHVACTYDGATLRMYVNGVQIDSTGGGEALSSGTQGLTLGANNPTNGNDRFQGALDDVRIYASVRTQAQLCVDAQRATCP